MAVKAPFNYIGNKYRIINSIQAYFPNGIDNFVDLFCGGCDVSINTKANKRYANDSWKTADWQKMDVKALEKACEKHFKNMMLSIFYNISIKRLIIGI